MTADLPKSKDFYLGHKRDRLPKYTPELVEYIEEWVQTRSQRIFQLRERPSIYNDEYLHGLGRSDLERWTLCDVGLSRVAWMERDITSTAQLIDYRSRRFGSRLKKPGTWERARIADNIAAQVDSDPESLRLTQGQIAQAEKSAVFAGQWYRYLTELVACPPRERNWSLPNASLEDQFFGECHPQPGPHFGRMIAEMAHCRPVGAFFTTWMNDKWTNFGGRDECRKPSLCPHCHARRVTRIVGRVEEGPWKKSRRRKRHLVLLRAPIPSSALSLDDRTMTEERDTLRYEERFRFGRADYSASTRDETTLRNIDVNQHLDHTITPHEVRKAKEMSRRLLKFAQGLGIEGGMRVHQIGPRHRNFLHELSIVGEITFRDSSRHEDFLRALGVGSPKQPNLCGSPIECVIVPPTYRDAARLLIAGSSWGFDLDQIGADLNAAARAATYRSGGGWLGEDVIPVGLRGALCWQPLVLFTSSSFWSRHLVIGNGRHRDWAPFGTWNASIPPDRKYRSAVQWKRWHANGGCLKDGSNRKVYKRLEAWRMRLRVPKIRLAEGTDLSRSTVSRYLTNGYGSERIADVLKAALRQIESESIQRSGSVLASGGDVSVWLEKAGRSQVWLAGRLGISESKVSRHLNGQTKWSPRFSSAVNLLWREVLEQQNEHSTRNVKDLAIDVTHG